MSDWELRTDWDIRPATGSDNNGGCFVRGAAGTDYSQQASPQYALTGIASSGSGDTVLSAAAASDMVGNGAQVLSGTNFNQQFYQVVSVVVGVSITFSKNLGGGSICSGVGAAGVINIGGAMATLLAAFNPGGSNQSFTGGGSRFYLKGTLTVTAVTGLFRRLVSGNFGYNSIIGYTTTHGDGTFACAKITTSTNNASILGFGESLGWSIENIEFESTAGTPGHGLYAVNSDNSGAILVKKCLFHGFLQGIMGSWNIAYAFSSIVLFECEIHDCTGDGILNDGMTALLGSYVHDNAGNGMRAGTDSRGPVGIQLVWRSVIKSNGGKGIKNDFDTVFGAGRFPIIIDSDVLNNTGDGVTLTGADGPALVMVNPIIDGNGGWGVNVSSADVVLSLFAAVAWRSNTSGDVTGMSKSATDITPTGDPLPSRGSDDFTPDTSTGVGGIGEPSTFPPS